MTFGPPFGTGSRLATWPPAPFLDGWASGYMGDRLRPRCSRRAWSLQSPCGNLFLRLLQGGDSTLFRPLKSSWANGPCSLNLGRENPLRRALPRTVATLSLQPAEAAIFDLKSPRPYYPGLFTAEAGPIRLMPDLIGQLFPAVNNLGGNNLRSAFSAVTRQRGTRTHLRGGGRTDRRSRRMDSTFLGRGRALSTIGQPSYPKARRSWPARYRQ